MAKDLTRGRLSPALLWELPIVAIVIGGFLDLEIVLWPPALIAMGVACLANAIRCQRMHCYFTGPWFLVLAALSLLHGLDVVPLGNEGWRWLGIATGIGGIALYYLPERLLGKYAATHRRGLKRRSL